MMTAVLNWYSSSLFCKNSISRSGLLVMTVSFFTVKRRLTLCPSWRIYLKEACLWRLNDENWWILIRGLWDFMCKQCKKVNVSECVRPKLRLGGFYSWFTAQNHIMQQWREDKQHAYTIPKQQWVSNSQKLFWRWSRTDSVQRWGHVQYINPCGWVCCV